MIPSVPTSSVFRTKVGRVVTCYGQWHLIDRWLSDERLQQPHVSWIFINDKPSDPLPSSMRARVESFGRVIEPKVNMGRCCARNLGIQQLDSEWVDIIDGDDLPYPLDADFDSEASDCGFMYFDVVHHREKDGRIVPDIDKDWVPSAWNQLVYELTGNYDIRPIAVLWRKATLTELGGFDGRTEFVEDLNLVLRARLGGFSYAKTTRRKGSYQRDTPGRVLHPILAAASLRNWELARPLAKGKTLEAVEEQVLFWRKALIWTGMREMEKSNPSLGEKLRESIKWMIGRHRT